MKPVIHLNITIETVRSLCRYLFDEVTFHDKSPNEFDRYWIYFMKDDFR